MGSEDVELAGRLLVATPLLGDANFERTVVLLLAHGDEGAFGVVLNRPSESDALELVPAWGGRAAEPSVMFLGGPVARNAVVGLGLGSGDEAGPGFQPVLGRLGTVDLNHEPVADGGVGPVRLFAGSAGWGSGQLEGEIKERAWWVLDAEVDDVLTADPASLWSRVLRRQRGELAWFANCPRNPSLN